MPICTGGSKSNLVTSLEENDDCNVDYGWHTRVAMTFTLGASTAVWRCLFKSWGMTLGGFFHYSIRATDIAGKPVGDDLVHTTLTPSLDEPPSPGKWTRFDFIDMPVLAAGVYALLAWRPGSTTAHDNHLRGDETAPPYAGGKAWKSTDQGVTWTEIVGTDLLFQVWGWEPPPLPPPPPVVSNWAPVKNLTDNYPEGYLLQFTTDNICHLWVRWTNVEPEQHKIPRERAGTVIFDDKRFCFVAWHEVEQLEAGDTFIHTFILEDWPIGETRWWYYIGTRAGEQLPSTSPIFKLTKGGEPVYIIDLGKLGDIDTLTGHVKLKEGTGVTLTRDDVNNAIEIAAAGGQYVGFGSHWTWFASDGSPMEPLDFQTAELAIGCNRSGQNYIWYTSSHQTISMYNHMVWEARVRRTTPLGGTPGVFVGLAYDNVNVIEVPSCKHIGFKMQSIYFYCHWGDGTHTGQQALANTDFGSIAHLRFEVKTDRIKFYWNNVWQYDAMNYLPPVDHDARLVFQVRGWDNFPRAFAMSQPLLTCV